MRKLDKQTARRIVDFMDERIAGLEDPRSTGKALTGPLGGFWPYAGGRLPGDLRHSERRLAGQAGA
jgi:mRNA interferase RelE/StbE